MLYILGLVQHVCFQVISVLLPTEPIPAAALVEKAAGGTSKGRHMYPLLPVRPSHPQAEVCVSFLLPFSSVPLFVSGFMGGFEASRSIAGET